MPESRPKIMFMSRRFSSVLLALALTPTASMAEIEEAPLVGGLRDLKQLNRHLVAMAPEAQEATVALVSRGGRGSGSGVIVSEYGLVMTAAHVMASLSDQVIVILQDGRRFDAKKLGADFDRDAALVQITEKGSFTHAEIGDSEELRRNDWCIAVGHPGGFDPTRRSPFRLGRVLSTGNFVVTDCAVVGGDSGGPLFDPEGRVIGIHSNIGMTLSQNRHVPVAVFRDQWEELKSGRRQGSRFGGEVKGTDPDRPVMGVGLKNRAANDGVEITQVMPDSPAEKAGLKVGDVVVSVGDEPVRRMEELIEVVKRFSPGNRIKVEARRGKKTRPFLVKLTRIGDLMKQGELAPEDEADQEAEEAEEDSPEEALERFLDEQLDKGGEGQLKLELTPEKIEEFGGMEKLMERLKQKVRERKGEEPEQAEEEAEEEPREVAELSDEQMRELLKQAMMNEGNLQMEAEEAERYGGAAAVGRKIAEMVRSMKPEELAEFVKESGLAAEDKFFMSSMKALRPVVRKTQGSTVEVLADGEAVALGTMVDERGRILTKDTETREGKLRVRVAARKHDAEVIERFPKWDLALLEIEGDGFQAVDWAAPDQLKLGALLAAPGSDGEPVGIGMVSVLSRALAEIGFLGIATDAEQDEVVIRQVIKGSAAEAAELKAGDRVLRLNDWEVTDMFEFSARIRGLRVGEVVHLRVLRDDEVIEKSVELGERPANSEGRRFQRMNEMSGPMSERTDGFREVLQHDIPLEPELCGGPLLDLQGRCVGINVSRAGRVKTYAIQSDVVRELLGEVADDPAEDEDMREVRALIQEVRENLEQLEEKLEEKLEEMEAR